MPRGHGASGEGRAHLTIRRAHAMSRESRETAPRDDTGCLALERSRERVERHEWESRDSVLLSFNLKLPPDRGTSVNSLKGHSFSVLCSRSSKRRIEFTNVATNVQPGKFNETSSCTDDGGINSADGERERRKK